MSMICETFTRLMKLFVLAVFVCASHLAMAGSVPVLSPQYVAGLLADGGYVLYLRHGATDRDQTDDVDTDFSDCQKQRNLSDAGREESVLTGQKIAALGMRIDTVLTSPYCRCVDTARLVFSGFDIDPLLASSSTVSPEQSEKQARHLQQLLSTPLPTGTNLAIVAHTANLREATGIWPKPEGVLHVFKPLGDDQYQHLGLVLPESWQD